MIYYLIGFGSLYALGVILFVFVFVKKHRLKVERILDVIQKSMNYCIRCGTSLEAMAEGKCSICGYIFPYKNFT